VCVGRQPVSRSSSLLAAYLPYTDDLSDSVPIERVVHDFMVLAGDFKPEPDVEGPITARDLRRLVVVTGKRDAEEGSYAYERNEFVSIGAQGRVAAVRGDDVVVMHKGRGFPHSRSWPIPAFEGTQYARIHRARSFRPPARWTDRHPRRSPAPRMAGRPPKAARAQTARNLER